MEIMTNIEAFVVGFAISLFGVPALLLGLFVCLLVVDFFYQRV